jgi:uncharacterized membrane protein YgcG
MRKLITAIATAAITTAYADTGPQEPVGFVKVVGAIFTAATGFKTLIEAWDWVTQRWIKPPLKPAQIWLCAGCRFSPPGSPATMTDHAIGDAFIKQAFPGKEWQVGQGLIACTGETCFTFKFDGNSHFYAVDEAFADPLVGYANPGGMLPPPAPVPRQSPGGGETGAPYAPRSSTVWSPNVVYNPGSQPFRTGTVTVIPGPGVTFGGGGGGGGGGGFGGGGGSHFIGPLPHD